MHVALRVLPLPASATALQPPIAAAPSRNAMLPVGAAPATPPCSVTAAPAAAGLASLASVVVVATAEHAAVVNAGRRHSWCRRCSRRPRGSDTACCSEPVIAADTDAPGRPRRAGSAPHDAAAVARRHAVLERDRRARAVAADGAVERRARRRHRHRGRRCHRRWRRRGTRAVVNVDVAAIVVPPVFAPTTRK